jgi:hypothetical protein
MKIRLDCRLQHRKYYHDRDHLCAFGKRLNREADVLEGLKQSRMYYVQKKYEPTRADIQNQYITSYWQVVVSMFDKETTQYFWIGATGSVDFLLYCMNIHNLRVQHSQIS